MYSAVHFQARRILIVKTSSLGDVVQAFAVLNYLRDIDPFWTVDWAIDARFASIVGSHPMVARTVVFDFKGFKQRWHRSSFWKSLFCSFQSLRKHRYDAVFDLQGNCKSAVITAMSKSLRKIGFGKKCVREWPNLLVTNERFDIPRTANIREQYVMLVQKGLGHSKTNPSSCLGLYCKVSEKDKFLWPCVSGRSIRILVCPWSQWKNKQLTEDALAAFLQRIEQKISGSFLLVWGNGEERESCLRVQQRVSHCSIAGKLTLPALQNLMIDANLVIAVDSGALHLCSTTSTPTFSIFGPTVPEIFKPQGPFHCAYRGACPYKIVFEKQCPRLRSCETGACMRQIEPETLFAHFLTWWEHL